MKCHTLVALLADGTMHAIADAKAEPILKLAAEVALGRKIKIGKAAADVISAVVQKQNGGSCSVVKRIMCAADAAREKAAKK